jgi:protein-tyrosine kinase
MSRIHEALKKAAEERASSSASSTAADFIDVSAKQELERSRVSPEIYPANLPSGVNPSRDPSVLRFEELRRRCSHPTWRLDRRLSAFNDQESEKGGSECFRTLRSRLHQIAATRALKRILVTSSVPAEGKTFVTANLAMSIIRQPNRRVLLIDADLRASRLHLPFGAPATPGLTEYLRGDLDEYSVIQSGISENLCLIAGGSETANPSELLLSERMKRLLDFATPIFDFVILDSPPAIPVHDPILLADFCDGTLLVVRADVTDVEVACRAAAEFEHKNLLGVVLNGVGPDATYGEYYCGSYGSADRK